ncbi:MAG: methyltransferase domain-containing protein [bacterium]|nr:methyltransferase domain-containing protein [bacterium]
MNRTDYFKVWSEIAKRFTQIGMVAPSSRFFARDMIAPVLEKSGRRSILEVGPGTGPFTRQILKVMGPEDELVICEINGEFLRHLKTSLEKNPYYCRHQERVRFFEGPVQDLRNAIGPDMRFDAIVTSLPFNNFTSDLVEELLNIFRDLCKEDGSFTFCEYWGVRKISTVFSRSARRERLKAVDSVVKSWCRGEEHGGKVEKKLTVLNVPPALAVQTKYGSRNF